MVLVRPVWPLGRGAFVVGLAVELAVVKAAARTKDWLFSSRNCWFGYVLIVFEVCCCRDVAL